MFDSALDRPSSPDCGSADEWQNQQLLDLQSQLDRTREELEVFRRTTAQILTGILAELHARPAGGTSPEILRLADLTEADQADLFPEPNTEEIESIDVGNQESLAYLDRRFRWLRSHQKARN